MEKLRVLAISGSQRKQSFTEKMLDTVIKGMGDVVVDKFYPHKMKIGPCTSCWSCWGNKNPGVCVQHDDFDQILVAYKKADYLLIAAPLYIFHLPATVKNIIDRFFIILESDQVQSERGDTEHPKRFNRHPKTVLISSCGFPELENFEILSLWLKKLCAEADWPWAGEILIPAAGLANAPKFFDAKYSAMQQAGKELVAIAAISKETMAKISEPVISAENYRKLANASFRGGLKGTIDMILTGAQAIKELNKK